LVTFVFFMASAMWWVHGQRARDAASRRQQVKEGPRSGSAIDSSSPAVANNRRKFANQIVQRPCRQAHDVLFLKPSDWRERHDAP